VSQQCVTAVCHSSVSQQCVTAVCHSSVSQQGVTAVCHSSVSQQGVTAVCHSSVSQQCVYEWTESSKMATQALDMKKEPGQQLEDKVHMCVASQAKTFLSECIKRIMRR